MVPVAGTAVPVACDTTGEFPTVVAGVVVLDAVWVGVGAGVASDTAEAGPAVVVAVDVETAGEIPVSTDAVLSPVEVPTGSPAAVPTIAPTASVVLVVAPVGDDVAVIPSIALGDVGVTAD